MGTLGQLNSRHFAAKIRQYGEVPAFWLQRVGECPRSHVDAFRGFSPDNDCPLCGGTGEVFRSMTLPTTSELTGGKVLANVIDTKRNPAPVDLIAGDLRLAFIETDYPFAEGDRLGFTNRYEDHSELLVRGTGTGDRLRFSPALSVLALYTEDGLFPSDSYVISTNKREIQFSGSGGPASPSETIAAGAQYTIRYRYRPPFFIVQGSFQRKPAATNGNLFPTEAVVRRYIQGSLDQQEGQP